MTGLVTKTGQGWPISGCSTDLGLLKTPPKPFPTYFNSYAYLSCTCRRRRCINNPFILFLNQWEITQDISNFIYKKILAENKIWAPRLHPKMVVAVGLDVINSLEIPQFSPTMPDLRKHWKIGKLLKSVQRRSPSPAIYISANQSTSQTFQYQWGIHALCSQLVT